MNPPILILEPIHHQVSGSIYEIKRPLSFTIQKIILPYVTTNLQLQLYRFLRPKACSLAVEVEPREVLSHQKSSSLSSISY